MDEGLIYEILSVVEEIPVGKVATYGQVARLIGREKNARLVGKVLGMAQYYGKYPCHRMVNHAGRLAPGWPEQAALLTAEGVSFKSPDHVDLKTCLWEVCPFGKAAKNIHGGPLSRSSMDVLSLSPPHAPAVAGPAGRKGPASYGISQAENSGQRQHPPAYGYIDKRK